MNGNPKISVIVPVYRAENYLYKCVDSLLTQTFTDFEILLVNDGSPDRSGEICDEYARKDGRVRVFHKENGGVSSARQCGMDHAQGEYTIHADPDDWVEPEMLEELYREAKVRDADMVICDYYTEYSDRIVYCKQEPSALDHETVLRELFQHLHGSCCNKLVRRTCCVNYDARFIPGVNYLEDILFNIALLRYPIKISYLNRAYYHYDKLVNSNSITMTTRSWGLIQVKNLIPNLERLLGNDNRWKELMLKIKSGIKIITWQEQSLPYKEWRILYTEVDPILGKEWDGSITVLFIRFSLLGSLANILSFWFYMLLLNLKRKIKNGIFAFQNGNASQIKE